MEQISRHKMLKLRRIVLLAVAIMTVLTACSQREPMTEATPEPEPEKKVAAERVRTPVVGATPSIMPSTPLITPPPQLDREATAEKAGTPLYEVSPLAVPTESPPLFLSPLPTPTYTPRPGFAIIQGVLFLMNPSIIAPREDGLYLVHIDDEALMVVPAVDMETSLQADVDEVTGRFSFADVLPGLYALVAVTDDGQQFSIRKFQTGEVSIISVREEDLDRVVDLGMLRLP